MSGVIGKQVWAFGKSEKSEFIYIGSFGLSGLIRIWGPNIGRSRRYRVWSHVYVWENGKTVDFYTLPHKSGGVLCYTLRTLSVCPSVCPSVSALFPCFNFSPFLLIFFKLCIDIGIGEELYGIASGIILFWNNSYGHWYMSKMLCASFPCSDLVPFYWFSSNFA